MLRKPKNRRENSIWLLWIFYLCRPFCSLHYTSFVLKVVFITQRLCNLYCFPRFPQTSSKEEFFIGKLNEYLFTFSIKSEELHPSFWEIYINLDFIVSVEVRDIRFVPEWFTILIEFWFSFENPIILYFLIKIPTQINIFWSNPKHKFFAMKFKTNIKRPYSRNRKSHHHRGGCLWQMRNFCFRLIQSVICCSNH